MGKEKIQEIAVKIGEDWKKPGQGVRELIGVDVQ